MKDTNILDKRKATTRGLHLLAAGGIVVILAVAATAMVVIGPDTVNATEIETEIKTETVE